ncbi:hypothetical protein Sjap_006805 [Stephania japonica]|uniref:C2 domain-containing protein n=1 Tax=Stephania japonica TaxID=461633 RepID=A0AAP0PK33_9MAGN
MAKRALEINVTAAKDLEDVRLLGQMKVYTVVSISYSSTNNMMSNQLAQAQRTPVDMKGETDPTWNFGMKFILDETVTEVVFELKCQRTESGDKRVGSVRVPVGELVGRAGNQRFGEVVEYQVLGQSGRPKGLLKFSYRFGECSGLPLIWPPLKHDLVKSNLRMLELNIGSAQDLENVRFLGQMKVYASVSISTDPSSTQRTHVDIKGEINPSWNFYMAFAMPTGNASTDHFLLVELKCLRTDGDKHVGEVRVPILDLLNRSQLSPETFASTSYMVTGPRNKSQKGLLNISYRLGDIGSVATMQHCFGTDRLVLGQPSVVASTGSGTDGGDVVSVASHAVVSSATEGVVSAVIGGMFGG